MARLRCISLAASSALILSGCFAWFDSGIEWRDGPYALTWVDTHGTMSLSYDTGNGGWGTVVDGVVFAVGSDRRYVVAKQHPAGNEAITNYFIVDKSLAPLKRESKAVVGPMSEREFAEKARALRLPEFARTIDDLK